MKSFSPTIFVRCLVCGMVLAGGIVVMSALAGLKNPPPEGEPLERALKVKALVVEPESVRSRIKGYGTVRALNQVIIAPEVSGNVVAIHPRLERGEIIKEGAVLFKIDRRKYQTAYEEIRATVNQLKNRIARLKKEYSLDQNRLKTLERNRSLERKEFERIQILLRSHKVGSQSAVDRAEQKYNAAADACDLMSRNIAVFPFQINEAENDLAAARARLETSLVDLSCCTVRAPFTCRIKEVSLEKYQYVSKGREVLTLADDSTLEILVPLDSRDASQCLQFSGNEIHGNNGWFNELKNNPCLVRWIEDKGKRDHQGILHRVVKFNETTRTLTVAVRIADSNKPAPSGQLPLVEGMFCEVTIPGRVLANVVRLPGHTVSFENTVSVYRAGRLKTLAVTVVRTEEEQVHVSSGLNPGDRVIITRLTDPLENTLLDVTECGSTASSVVTGENP